MFCFIYQVYAIELVSTLQLTLVVPLITLVLHSFFQIYVLISDYSPSDFNRIHLVVSLVFNCVMTKHTVCMIITSIRAAANPSSNIMLLFAAFEIIYRLWAAAKYTELLKMSFAKNQNDAGAAQAQVHSSEKNDVLVSNGNKLKGFYKDDKAADDAFEYQIKPAQETFNNQSTPFVVCSKIMSCENIKRYILIPGSSTVFYLVLCFAVLYYFSVVGNFSHLIYTNTGITNTHVNVH